MLNCHRWRAHFARRRTCRACTADAAGECHLGALASQPKTDRQSNPISAARERYQRDLDSAPRPGCSPGIGEEPPDNHFPHFAALRSPPSKPETGLGRKRSVPQLLLPACGQLSAASLEATRCMDRILAWAAHRRRRSKPADTGIGSARSAQTHLRIHGHGCRQDRPGMRL